MAKVKITLPADRVLIEPAPAEEKLQQVLLFRIPQKKNHKKEL